MSQVEYPVSGSCQCGAITYELKSAPLKVVACHCIECQKLSTSAFSITAMIEEDQIAFSGEMADWSRPADSGNISAAKFCPGCGNRLYHYNPKDPSQLKLKPSTLHDTRMIKPAAHIWVSKKQDWFEIPEGVPSFDEQP